MLEKVSLSLKYDSNLFILTTNIPMDTSPDHIVWDKKLFVLNKTRKIHDFLMDAPVMQIHHVMEQRIV